MCNRTKEVELLKQTIEFQTQSIVDINQSLEFVVASVKALQNQIKDLNTRILEEVEKHLCRADEDIKDGFSLTQSTFKNIRSRVLEVESYIENLKDSNIKNDPFKETK